MSNFAKGSRGPQSAKTSLVPGIAGVALLVITCAKDPLEGRTFQCLPEDPSSCAAGYRCIPAPEELPFGYWCQLETMGIDPGTLDSNPAEESILDFGLPDSGFDETEESAQESLEENAPESGDVAIGSKTLSFLITSDDTHQNCVGKASCNISLSYSQEREVAVLYTQGKTPLPSSAILWEIQEDTKSLGTLEAAQAYTDKDGLATNKIIQNKDNLKPGTFKVRIWVDGDDTVTPLFFNVTVTPKGVIPLSVRFADYKGAYPMLDQGKVRLFRQNLGKPACADLSVYKLPTATVAAPTFPLTQATTFPELPNLETEQTQTYTIVGLATVGAGPVQAWACDDKQGVVNWGQPTVVELVLQDLFPKIKGSYDVTSTFDLVSGLPPAVANVVDIVVGFFTSPTALIMILICKTGGSSGFMHDFCGYMFADPGDPVIDKLTGTGEIVFEIIDTILISLLQSQCPFTDKSLCSKIYFTGKDIRSIIEQFTLVSTFTFSADPDATGFIPATACEEVWHSVKLKWTLGKDCPPTDDTCGQMSFSLDAIPGIEETVSANFEAQIIDHSKITIKPHKLNLKYGALVDFAIEKVLLPQVFGDGKDGLPAVDSYEKLIGSLLGGKACLKKDDCCTIFAQNVTSQVGGLTTNLVEGACEALRTVGATYLRNTLMDLDATPDNFTIGTLEPCPLTDDDKNMWFDSFGKKNAQCKWDVKISFATSSFSPAATFYGAAK